MKSTKLAIFDFDGTLVDTREDIVSGVNQALEDLGLPRRPDADIAGFIGRGVEHLAAASLPDGRDDLLQPMLERFRVRYDQCYQQTARPYTGVTSGLSALCRRGLSLAVASNKPSRYLFKLLEKFQMLPLFISVIGGDQMERKKPDPWCIQHISHQSGTPRERVLMVGDMRYDVETGVNAGTMTCGVLYGYGSERDLRDAGAQQLVNDFPALMDLLG